MPLSSKCEQKNQHLEQKLNLVSLALFKWFENGNAQEKGE